MTTQSPSESEYRALLAKHDWFFAYSDDFNVYSRGLIQSNQLDSMRQKIDTNAAIWNEYAPDQFKLK